MPDGTEKFQGEERAAAKMALKEMDELEPNLEKILSFLNGEIKLKVEEVHKKETPTTGIHRNCKKLYTTVFSSITFFGIRKDSKHPTEQKYERTVCLEQEFTEKNPYSR
jgi:hypothetical protein